MKFRNKIGMALVLTGVMVATTGCFDSNAEGGEGGKGGDGGSATVINNITIDSGSNNSGDSNKADSTKQALTEAQSAIDAQNYEDAITTLENALKKSPSNKDLIAKYVNAVKLRVNELTSKNDYDKALAVLKSAKDALKDNEEINNLYDETKKNSPDKLCDLTIAESNDNYVPITEQKVVRDTTGNTYDPGNLFTLYPSYADYSGYAKYYLGEKYKSLNLIYAISEENPDDIDPTTFTIFGDGDKILFTSDKMTRTTEPTSIGVDVTGQKWIYIRVESETSNSVPVLMANPVLFE
ncbi:NPCBM/NEW2 domain-containing protein [Butyricicoccus sp.]|uniref:NPCBM/NEW2 domain-containing protein n=1 Tax=Butyricicoccus sp. TaxID=2049021 RepID=UPI003D7D3169